MKIFNDKKIELETGDIFIICQGRNDDRNDEKVCINIHKDILDKFTAGGTSRPYIEYEYLGNNWGADQNDNPDYRYSIATATVWRNGGSINPQKILNSIKEKIEVWLTDQENNNKGYKEKRFDI